MLYYVDLHVIMCKDLEKEMKHVELSGGKGMGLYGSGPCSKAEILKDDWFKV